MYFLLERRNVSDQIKKTRILSCFFDSKINFALLDDNRSSHLSVTFAAKYGTNHGKCTHFIRHKFNRNGLIGLKIFLNAKGADGQAVSNVDAGHF